MSTTKFIERCIAAGMPFDMALEAARHFEVECEVVVMAALEGSRAKARDRQAKHRQKITSANVMSRDQRDNAEQPPFPPSSPPGPPPTPTHTPGYISREREASPIALAKPNGFARFWEAYPSKVGKRDAERAFVRALARVGGPDPPGTILAGVERAKAGRRWREGFVPNPATWLNQDRWTDEEQPETPRNAPPPSPKLQARHENYQRAFAGSALAANRGV